MSTTLGYILRGPRGGKYWLLMGPKRGGKSRAEVGDKLNIADNGKVYVSFQIVAYTGLSQFQAMIRKHHAAPFVGFLRRYERRMKNRS